jgi:ABC-type multidrug transport system fused ATPase/permease subunit
MKKYVLEFLKRGFVAAWGGPLILAIIYGIEGRSGGMTSVAPLEACMGILSLTLLAFIVSGITVVYQTERLPLPTAILIHAGVLYLTYLLIYLLNSWLPRNAEGIGTFTLIFVVLYLAIWICIYFINRIKTNKLNKKLQERPAA